jgi:activator of HSP90 ATPase
MEKMKSEKITMSVVLPATPEKIYQAWLNSKEHKAFTGSAAKISGKVNSVFTAWDKYISGKILELDENKRIFLSWRTTEFPAGAEDSLLEILLEPKGKSCKLSLKHWNIPDGQTRKYKEGWNDFYFDPMKEYFSNQK